MVNIDEIGEINLSIDDKYLPGEILEKEDNKKIILGLMDDLPKKQREVLFLYYFQEMTGKEIAGSLGTSEASVKNALFKGRNNLKKSIEERFNLKSGDYGKFLGAGVALTELFNYQWTNFSVPSGLNKVVLGGVLKRIQYTKFAKTVSSAAAVALVVGGFIFAATNFGGTSSRQDINEDPPLVSIVEVQQDVTPLPETDEETAVTNQPNVINETTPSVAATTALQQYNVDNVVVVDGEKIETLSHYVMGAQEVVAADGSRYIAQSSYDATQSSSVAGSAAMSNVMMSNGDKTTDSDQIQGGIGNSKLPQTGNSSIMQIGITILGIVLCIAWKIRKQVMRS